MGKCRQQGSGYRDICVCKKEKEKNNIPPTISFSDIYKIWYILDEHLYYFIFPITLSRRKKKKGKKKCVPYPTCLSVFGFLGVFCKAKQTYQTVVLWE